MELTPELTKSGLTYFKISKENIQKAFKTMGVCDYCNASGSTLYLIPVLNATKCKECFDEWKERAVKYPEDSLYEERKIEEYIILFKEI
jgi:hypothetical protein